MDDPKVVGQRIKEARKRRKWTQTDLAEKLKGGHKQTISHWETGVRAPSTSSLRELAKVLDVNFSWLCGEVGNTGHATDILRSILSDQKIAQLEEGLQTHAQTRERVSLLIQEVLKGDPDNIALLDSVLNVITQKSRE